MPIYDYRCQDCGSAFEVLISWRDKDKVKCPECGGTRVSEKVASFASTSSGGSGWSGGGSSGGSCGSGGFS